MAVSTLPECNRESLKIRYYRTRRGHRINIAFVVAWRVFHSFLLLDDRSLLARARKLSSGALLTYSSNGPTEAVYPNTRLPLMADKLLFRIRS
jgi:hypothetical protein